MADEIFLRVSELKRKIRGLSAIERAENTDVKDSLQAISDLLSRRPYGRYNVSEVGQRARRIAVSTQERQLKDLLKHSSDLFRADQESSVIAGLQTPEQFLAMEKKLAQLRKTPKEIKHEQYVEEYGDIGATSVEAEERREKAESLLRQRRLKRGRQEQAAREVFRYDMMDEFDQKMADLTKRYGGDTGKADISMRNLLKKELPPFFKNSRMSTKDLHRTAEFFRSSSKIPFVGGMIKHPYATLATSAMWALGTYASSNITSAKAAVKWENISGVWGRPSDEFIKAAEDAGLKAEEIDSKWAQLSQKFGSPLALRAIGGMKPGIAKGFTMASLGLDEDAVRIFDKLSGAESSEARNLTEHVNKIETIEKYGFAPGTSAFTTMKAFGYRIPLLGKLKKWMDAKSLTDLEQIKDPEIRRRVEKLSGFSISDIDEPISDIRKAIYGVQSAAIADSQASEIISRGQGASGGSTNIKGDTHVTIEVGTIETDSPQDFIKQMKALGSQYFQEVGEAFDQKAR